MNLKILAEGESHILKNKGYSVETYFGLNELSEERYSRADCVIIHPIPLSIVKLRKFRERNPRVGLVITTGNGKGFEHDFVRDNEGVYILQEPSSLESFLNCIDKAIKESKVMAVSP